MKIKHLVMLSLIVASFQSCKKEDTPASPSTIVSDAFKTDAAGWTITGDAQGGYAAASYSPNGGVTDGYIYADDDVTGGTWYYRAPARYLGDKSSYYNETLQFSLFQHDDLSDPFEDRDIILESANKVIYCQLPKHPDTTWTDYKIIINESAGWVIGDTYGSTDTATQADIKEVLSNLTGFYIRGEFETGPDTGGMDNISIENK